MLIGAPVGNVGRSLWLDQICGRQEGTPPKIDLAVERKVGEFIRQCIQDEVVSGVHDVSDGGVLVTIAEMCLAGDVGAFIFSGPWEQFGSAAAFAEDQALYVVCTLERQEDMIARGEAAGVAVTMLGRVGGDAEDGTRRIVIDVVAPGYQDGGQDVVVSLADLRAAHEGFLPKLMGADGALA
jgi:phosphoribosylformylglycinamidine (FGAM) synthase-like enzyme